MDTDVFNRRNRDHRTCTRLAVHHRVSLSNTGGELDGTPTHDYDFYAAVDPDPGTTSNALETKNTCGVLQVFFVS